MAGYRRAAPDGTNSQPRSFTRPSASNSTSVRVTMFDSVRSWSWSWWAPCPMDYLLSERVHLVAGWLDIGDSVRQLRLRHCQRIEGFAQQLDLTSFCN